MATVAPPSHRRVGEASLGGGYDAASSERGNHVLLKTRPDAKFLYRIIHRHQSTCLT